MFFTQEDYRKIEKWFLANSRKDTDFAGAATPLKGNETVVLVQNGKNVKASVKDVVEQLFLLGVSDFVNITDKYGESYISLSQAIELIPYRSRKIGQVVTFLDDTGKWAMFQFQGTRKNQWGTLSLWVDLIDLMTGVTIIDSEDIVTETNSANQVSLKFADKVYNTADYSGLGRIYLRKNITKVEDPVTGNTITMNLLQQSMVSKENTIYIVQYSYDLNKQTISIPEGSILVFEGGDINNGTINCNGTIIVGKFSGNVTIAGTYSFQDAQADEEDITQNQSSVLKFKDKEYDEADFSGLGRTYLRKNIVNGVNILSQDMINNPNTIYHIQYDYNLNGQTITIPEGCVLRFNGGTISNGELKGNLLNEYLKPEWFGAKGDNSVNDSIAFQMAINLCNNSNTCKTIKLGQKHYLLDNIILYSYITLEGADKYNTILSSFGKLTDSPLITTGIEQGQNITIKNLCIESEGARTEYTVKIINKLGVTIDNCYIVRHDIEAITDKHGIFIGRDSTTPNATVYIPKFTNNRVNQCCVTIEGTDGYIDHNEIWGIGCESALHLMKSGNHMISANQIVGGSAYGALYCTEWATALKIFGNYFDGSSTAVANVPFGINVTANLTYSIISNNNFWHLYGVGIKVTTSIGNTINGNVFENNDTSDVGNPDIVFTNTQSGSITNNSFVRAGVTRINKAPVLNITGYTGTSYEPIIISGNTVRGYTNYSNAVYTPIDSTIKTSNNNCSIFEYISNANQYKIFNPYGELNYNSSETIKASPLDAKVFTYVETNRKIRLDNLNYVDSTALTGDNKFDFNQIYNKDFNLYINNYGSVLNPPVWITGAMWLENRYLTTGYCRQIIYSSNGNPLYSRICSNSIWSEWVNADATLRSKVSIVAKVADFSITGKIYKIVSDIDLQGETLTIPANCTLDFQGGSFSNGTITGNNTIVLPYGYKIQNVTLEGTFKYENGVNAISSDDICFNNEYDILDGRNLALKEIIGYNLQDDDYTILPQFDTIRNVNSVDGSFTGFPTSVIHNNLLYCFYYKAATHESTPGVQENIYYRYSSDKGVNWSDEKEWVLPASDVSGRFRSYRTAYAIPFGYNILFAIFCTTSTTSTLTGSFTLLCEASIDESNNITIVNQIKVPLIGTGGNLIYNYTDSTITNSMIVGGNIIKVGTNYLIACYTSDRDNYIFSFDGTFTDNTHLTILDSMISTEFDYTEHTFIKFSDTNFYIALREDKRRENTPIFKYNSSTSKFELFSYIDNVAYDGLDAILLNDSVAIIAGRDWRNYYTPTRFALINSSGSVFLSNAKYYGDVLGRDCGYCSLQIIDNTLVNIFYLKRSQPYYNYGIASRRIPVDVVLNLIFY